jgi:hypothetical protein
MLSPRTRDGEGGRAAFEKSQLSAIQANEIVVSSILEIAGGSRGGKWLSTQDWIDRGFDSHRAYLFGMEDLIFAWIWASTQRAAGEKLVSC